MDMNFYLLWIAILGFDGALMYSLAWAAESVRFSKYRIRTPKNYQIPPLRKAINTNLNNVLSLLIFIAFFIFAGERFLQPGWPGITMLLGETLLVLLLYDFMYYFFHRFMHHPKVLRHVHRVHHLVRFPTANESIFLHPLETIGGLGLLILSVLILGPISAYSFLLIFFVYSSVNIIVHSNLVIPHPAFRLFNFWSEKHDIHHSKLNYNYASIFPFWDQAFGTFK
jgi:sterol desaturase/sphingolipid hydroxylase (fatty acid hydroxylase superfamily)